MREPVYLCGAVRTPIGGFGGALADVPAPRLGIAVGKASMTAAGISSENIDEVVFGNVIGAGLGQNVARQIALGAGLPPRVGATTVNKVCGSGLKAVMMAAQAIQCGDASVVLAGGTESMSRAPYLLDKARTGYRMGDGKVIDSMIRDGLWDVYSDRHMGILGNQCAEKFGFSRDDQDDFAVESYQRAIAAIQDGAFDAEVTPIRVEGKREVVDVARDEEPGRFNEEKLRKLRPAFGAETTVTAGNASSVNDGAAAVVVASESAVESLHLQAQAKIVAYSTASMEPEWFTIAPIAALAALFEKASLAVDDIGLFEINEAFSVVPMAVMKELGIPRDKVNVNGGAVALGHPIGASGARILATLIHAMRLRQVKSGVAALCIGGGEAVAMAVERI